MVSSLTFTTQQEKIQFLLDYLEDKVPECPRTRPLILRDQGGTGKTAVLNELAKISPFSFVHLNLEGRTRVVKGRLDEEIPQGTALPLIVEIIQGSVGEEGFIRYLDGFVVQFVADPLYLRAA